MQLKALTYQRAKVIAQPVHHQLGFTLVELMISLVLGLLISAAVMQVYLTNVRTTSTQQSGSELQDASIFGLQQLEDKIRLANLGNPEQAITSNTPKGGVVLSADNIIYNGIASTYDDVSYYTQPQTGSTMAENNRWTGMSNTNVSSDQLTIQYTNTTGEDMFDCEGATVATGDHVVERYFLRQATGSASTGDIKNLVLACDAGRINASPIAATQASDLFKSFTPASDTRNFGQAGQVIIDGVDQFKVLLGTQSVEAGSAGQMMYLPSSVYLGLADKPAIVAIKIGLIAHGSTPIIGSEDQTSFNLLGQSNTLKADSSRKKQVRNTYESTVALRNARVMTIDTSS